MQHDGFDQLELLAYVEGDLAPRQCRALESRLSGIPELRASLDAMIADRRGLRRLADPELPADLVANLEPQLARPMLMGATPQSVGSYRRRHAPPRSHGGVRRLALAAGIALALGVGVWGSLWIIGGGLSTNTGDRMDGRIVSAGENAADDNEPKIASNPTIASEWAEDARVHHASPTPGRVLLASGAENRPSGPSGPVLIRAAFRLVVEAPEATVEEALAAVLAHSAETTALVRNYTQDEADLLLAQLLAAPAGGSSGARLFSELDPDEVERRLEIPRERNRAVADWLRQARVDDARRMQASLRSGQLTGPREIAPSYEMQLSLSAAGATHALTVPVERTAAFLADLRRDHPGLRVRLEVDAVTQSGSEMSWYAQLPMLTEWLAEVRENATDAHHLIVPVVIR